MMRGIGEKCDRCIENEEEIELKNHMRGASMRMKRTME